MLQHFWEFDYFKMAIRRMNGMGQLGVLFSLDVFICAQISNKIISPTVAQIVVAMKFAFSDTGERIIVRESCARFCSATRHWPGYYVSRCRESIRHSSNEDLQLLLHSLMKIRCSMTD